MKSGLKVNISLCNSMTDLQEIISKCTLTLKRFMINKAGLPPMTDEIKVEFSKDKDVTMKVFCEYKMVKDKILYKKYALRTEYEPFDPQEVE